MRSTSWEQREAVLAPTFAARSAKRAVPDPTLDELRAQADRLAGEVMALDPRARYPLFTKVPSAGGKARCESFGVRSSDFSDDENGRRQYQLALWTARKTYLEERLERLVHRDQRRKRSREIARQGIDRFVPDIDGVIEVTRTTPGAIQELRQAQIDRDQQARRDIQADLAGAPQS
jgi:hypothetical protein